ncbi:MAG: DNA processing protein dpra, putative [Microgenomates bacterium 39_6]|nr:MAG: DNA processing protein dpra, putative [Microgenomates bacterium 39_6]
MSQEQANKERPFWTAFNYLADVGSRRFGKIINNFGSAQKAWQAGDKDWRKLGLNKKIIDRFFILKKKIDPEKLLESLINSYQPSIWPIIKIDDYYPKNLLNIDDAPPVLYARGKIAQQLSQGKSKSWQSFWSSPVLAFVGTRKPSAYGRQIASRLGEELARSGLIIVSGLAYGIDTLAHRSALEADGKTVAVLGSGVDVVYPSSNNLLYREILESGLVFSELPPGTRPLPGHFPARNRIISGLASAVLVIEGGLRSGSLITASLAANQGRDVLAVPGSITSQLSSGTNYLIRNGAKLVTEANDVLEEFDLALQVDKQQIGLTEDERLVINLLSSQNLTADEIGLRSKFEASRVGVILTKLEIKGLVVNLGLGKWGRR